MSSQPGLTPLHGFAGTDRFRPVALLGRGSMGVVYRVQDTETGAEVALKTLVVRDPSELYRLKNEFRSLSDVVHRNLVELYELLVDERDCFFTMEFVDGVSFVEYVRRDTDRADYERLTTVLPQLVAGIAAIHAEGKLHRDVKPSNVLVTASGRVVVLDFGLVTLLGGARAGDTEPGLVGTLAYMAPEQAWGKEPNPTADWYSVGAMLYEAVTGRVPFEGPAARMLADRNRAVPPAPSTLVSDVPEDLNALAVALLDPEPPRRPGPEEILSQLQPRPGTAQPRRVRHEAAEVPFVGRTEELAELRRAFARLSDRQPNVVMVEGPSGIGKSELVRRFLSEIETDEQTVVLDGRCHPYEAVPYKALDSLIDRLSRFLMTLPETAAAALVPRHAAALTRLFPVLARVPALASWQERDDTAEPYEVRRRGFAALREVLARISDRRPLVLWIDDFQWGDADSAVLLRELLAPPDPPVMLLLVSYRSEDRENAPLVDTLKTCLGDLTAEAIHRVVLSPLSAGETQDLATRLSGLPASERIAAIADEAAGSPFLVTQLARYATMQQLTEDSAERLMMLDLPTLLAGRIEQLGASAQELLELVSIAGRPLDRSVALEAAGIGERGRPFIARLEHEGLLRSAPRETQPTVEVYHDRIREVIAGQLSGERLRIRHRQLAETIERQPAPDPDALFHHFLGADERQRAGEWAVRAADRAADTLAFERAAGLYREAIRLRDNEGERPALLAKRGEALANAGRGREAGEALQQAAVAMQNLRADPVRILDVERRAAEQYLRAGHLREGTAATRSVLKALGVQLPATRRSALALMVRQRIALAWRGLRFTRGSVGAPVIRLRLDALWSTAITLGLVDQIVADIVGIRHLTEALDAGETGHIIRALGWEAAKGAQVGGIYFGRRSRRLFSEVERLVRDSADPYEQAFWHVTRGCAAYVMAHWRSAYELNDGGIAILRAQCTGVRWEIVTFETFALSALAHMGQLKTLARRLPQAVQDADDHDDVYAGLGLRCGVLNLHWLGQDRPEEARKEMDAALGRWHSEGDFHIQHYLHLIGSVQTDLYVGDAVAAWQRVQAAWPALRAAMFLNIQSTRVELRNLRARAALAVAAADPSRRRELLALVEHDATAIARDRDITSAASFATLLRAGAAESRGQDGQALALYAQAAARFTACDMGLYAAATRRREGRLRGGDQGCDLVGQSEAWIREQGVRNVPAMAAALLPFRT